MNSEDLRVGLITEYDPADRRSWSGIHYRMSQSLKQEFTTVIHLGPVKLNRFIFVKMKITLFFISLFHRLIYGKKFNKDHNHLRSKYHSQFIDKQIAAVDVDVLFAPTASVQIAHLKSNIPICYFSDTTFSLMCNYYGSFSKFSDKSIRVSNEIEQLAINKSMTQVYPSNWALNSAKVDYHARNPFLVKMGANFDHQPVASEFGKHPDATLEVLFVGVDWKRKGGDIVLETIKNLSEKGHKVHLTVCGCTPPLTNPKMTVIPFLDKNNSDDLLKFEQLYKEADLFFMPTRAECYGVAFCEANAYGLPVISTDTGGVSSIIEDGKNGFLLPPEATSDEYMAILEKLISDKELMQQMSKTAREKYEDELNWAHWGNEMKKILLLTKQLAESSTIKDIEQIKLA